MPKNHFKDNRLNIQRAFITRKFLKPLTKEDLPLEIVEKNNKAGNNTLRIVRIDNIPVSDEFRPVSYVLDVELSKEIFSSAPGFRTVEKVIFLLTKKCLYVVLVEMKSALSAPIIREITGKIPHTIGRIALFLTHYLLDEKQFDDCEIKFSTIIFYNTDSLANEINAKTDRSLEDLDLVKIFSKKEDRLYATEPLGKEYKVDVIFKQNPARTQEIDFDFSEVFKGNQNYKRAIEDDRTLP